MRKPLIAALLFLFVLQSSGVALAAPSDTSTVYSTNGVAMSAARQIAAEWLSNMSWMTEIAMITPSHSYQVPLLDVHALPRPHQLLSASEMLHGERTKPRVTGIGTLARGPQMLLRPLGARESMSLPAPVFVKSTPAANTIGPRTTRTVGRVTPQIVYYTIGATPSTVSGSAGTSQDVTITCMYNNSIVPCSTATASSSNASVAAASSDLSAINLIAAGSATITYTYHARTATINVTVSAAATPTPTPAPTPTPCPSGWSGSPPNCVAPTPTPTPTPAPTQPPLPQVTVGQSATGINPWWTYEEGAVPGIGKYMVNVANGNLITQADDVDVPERGVDLAFRRTYNSMSGRDWNRDDNAPTPGMYGSGWTNSFDAHLALNSAGGISVYDIDGARYDYTPNGSGCWVPPPGQHATLCTDGNAGIFWTKKNGTVYYFWRPDFSVGWPQYSALAGRTYQIWGRNHNNVVTFNYYFGTGTDYGNATDSQNLTQIVAQHSDGQALTLTFGIGSSGHRLLSSVTRPDGVAISYAYDSADDLTAVYLPNNGTATINQNRTEQYGWFANHQMYWAAPPRWWVATAGTDGGYTQFAYSGAALSSVQYNGVFSPANIPDGTGTQLQSGFSAGSITAVTKYFGYASTYTHMADTDGHQSYWYFDGAGRVTESDELTGTQTLSSRAQWDPNNNLIATIDPRGYATGNYAAYETDYAYDGNGNTVAVAQPQVTTAQGTFRPTTLISYDAYNNITVYCDPIASHTAGGDWVGSAPGQPYTTPSDTMCGSMGGRTRYTWAAPADGTEPFGQLTDAYSPCYGYSSQNCNASSAPGNHEQYTYGYGAQDYGLPLTVTGTSFSNLDGSGVITPTQTFTYDTSGNLATYDKGQGAHWTLSYDNLNRLTATTDPDANTNGMGALTSYRQYFPDGSIQCTATPAQFAANGNTICGSNSPAYAYDADGDEASETHHYGNVAGPTQKWYDGADRLVDVQTPSDASTDNGIPWRTRYIYDLSGSSAQAQIFGTNAPAPFWAYGNLFKTQNYFNGTWNDVNGNAYDGLDRSVARYQYSPGNGLQKWSSTYDGGAYAGGTYAGLLVSKADPMGVVTSYTYDAASRQSAISFSDGTTPSRSYTYDADGRAVSIQSSTFGTDTYQYDADGQVTQYAEGSGGGATSPATLNYSYYSNGERSALSVVSGALNQSNQMTYDYRADGERLKLTVAGQSQPFAWTYSNAGRELTQSDPLTGVGAVLPQFLASPPKPYFAQHSYVARTQTYDSYGQLSSLELPDHGLYSNIAHDAEGNPTTMSVGGDDAITPLQQSPWSQPYTNTVSLSYDIRGELTTTAVANGGGSTGNTYLYGHSCPWASGGFSSTPSTNCGATVNSYYAYPTGAQVVDPYTGTTATGSAYYNSKQSQSCPGVTPRIQFMADLHYDADGRQSYQSLTAPANNQGCISSIPTVDSWTYDAENHTTAHACGNASDGDGVSVPCDGNSLPVSLGWGPSGKVRTESGEMMCSAYGPYTLHWDGDDLLFATDSRGVLVQTNIEKLGAILTGCPSPTIQGLTVFDRDFSETEVSAHNAGGEQPWIISPPRSYQIGKGTGTVGACVGCSQAGANAFQANVLFNSQRSDGYEIGSVIVQGARAYDSNTTQWTTPDAYKGDVHDPMSQRSYMWNNNNPISYSDPSGYNPLGDAATAAWNFVAGDDIHNLTSKDSSFTTRLIAGASLASTFIAPEAKGVALATKGAIVAVHMSEHALMRSGVREISQKAVDVAIRRGTKYADSKYPLTTAHVLEHATTGGASIVVNTSRDNAQVITVQILKRANQVANRISSGRYRPH